MNIVYTVFVSSLYFVTATIFNFDLPPQGCCRMHAYQYASHQYKVYKIDQQQSQQAYDEFDFSRIYINGDGSRILVKVDCDVYL